MKYIGHEKGRRATSPSQRCLLVLLVYWRRVPLNTGKVEAGPLFFFLFSLSFNIGLILQSGSVFTFSFFLSLSGGNARARLGVWATNFDRYP